MPAYVKGSMDESVSFNTKSPEQYMQVKFNSILQFFIFQNQQLHICTYNIHEMDLIL